MNKWRAFAGVLLLILPVVAAHAVTFRAPIDKAVWELESSPFECRMWQPIPYYGDAVFSNRAGYRQEFYLAPTRSQMRQGKAALISQAPVWHPHLKEVDLGYVAVVGRDNERPIKLREKLATRLLSELFEGMSPMFTRRAWQGDDISVRVGLSSVNFRKAYGQYQNCLTQLLPASFDQIARTRIHFISAKWELTEQAKRALNLIIRYSEADPSIDGFYVDGHTDNVGRRLYNLELSKKTCRKRECLSGAKRY